MKTLTVEEAGAGLARWVERALADEQIRIRKGDAVVELRPAYPDRPVGSGQLTPRDALRQLQKEARLKPEHAERYLRELREEHLAAELFNQTGQRRGSRFGFSGCACLPAAHAYV